MHKRHVQPKDHPPQTSILIMINKDRFHVLSSNQHARLPHVKVFIPLSTLHSNFTCMTNLFTQFQCKSLIIIIELELTGHRYNSITMQLI